MAKCSSSTHRLEKHHQSKLELQNEGRTNAGKKERKPRGRYLTDEMLENYRVLSQERGIHKRAYDEAAFRVYGTLPPGEGYFKAALSIRRGRKYA